MPRRASKTGGKNKATGKRYPLNMRTTFEMRRQLERAATESGRSLAQEAEFRLDRSFVEEDFEKRLIREIFGDNEIYGIVRIIAIAMRDAGETAGFFDATPADGSFQWLDNPFAFDQAIRAATTVLEHLRPVGKIETENAEPEPRLNDAVSHHLGAGFAKMALVEAASGTSHSVSPQEQERARQLHRDIGRLAQRVKTRLQLGIDK
jgi:hypothetical protein